MDYFFFSAGKVSVFILSDFTQPTLLSKQMQRTISVWDTSKADSKCLTYQHTYFPHILSWLLNYSLCIARVISTLNCFEIPPLFTGIQDQGRLRLPATPCVLGHSMDKMCIYERKVFPMIHFSSALIGAYT